MGLFPTWPNSCVLLSHLFTLARPPVRRVGDSIALRDSKDRRVWVALGKEILR